MMATNQTIDPTYLHDQYGDAEKLRIRQESHQRYSERTDAYVDWLLQQLGLEQGQWLLDIGCGPGTLHPAMARAGVQIFALDPSTGMLDEVQAQAAARRLPVHALQGVAEALPLAAASCDRVLASHMLYHVPNQQAALAEMARVLKRGGRVVITANGADSLAALHRFHREAAAELGYSPVAGPDAIFNLEHGEIVRQFFPNVRRHMRPDAFLFPAVEPALRYYASGMVDAITPMPADGSHRPALLQRVGQRLAALLEREGLLRLPKDVGCFVAER